MSTKKYDLALVLANFNLIVNGYRLLLTTDNEETLKAVLANFSRLNPDTQYCIRYYGVKPLSKKQENPPWELIDGYSLWEPVQK